jgi:hypothetical protein
MRLQPARQPVGQPASRPASQPGGQAGGQSDGWYGVPVGPSMAGRDVGGFRRQPQKRGGRDRAGFPPLPPDEGRQQGGASPLWSMRGTRARQKQRAAQSTQGLVSFHIAHTHPNAPALLLLIMHSRPREHTDRQHIVQLKGGRQWHEKETGAKRKQVGGQTQHPAARSESALLQGRGRGCEQSTLTSCRRWLGRPPSPSAWPWGSTRTACAACPARRK